MTKLRALKFLVALPYFLRVCCGEVGLGFDGRVEMLTRLMSMIIFCLKL